MNLPITWAPSAKDEYALLLEYVEQNFGLDAALELLATTEGLLEEISAFPKMFPASQKRKQIRKAVISNKLPSSTGSMRIRFRSYTSGITGKTQIDLNTYSDFFYNPLHENLLSC